MGVPPALTTFFFLPTAFLAGGGVFPLNSCSDSEDDDDPEDDEDDEEDSSPELEEPESESESSSLLYTFVAAGFLFTGGA